MLTPPSCDRVRRPFPFGTQSPGQRERATLSCPSYDYNSSARPLSRTSWWPPSILLPGCLSILTLRGLKPKRTSIQSPWQNGTAERWVGSCRREILDHVIALDERHLLRLMRDYVTYYQEDRIHDGLSKDTPSGRPSEQKPSSKATVISSARLGGLHHRYSWEEAA